MACYNGSVLPASLAGVLLKLKSSKTKKLHALFLRLQELVFDFQDTTLAMAQRRAKDRLLL